MRAGLRWGGYNIKEPHGVAWKGSDRKNRVEKILLGPAAVLNMALRKHARSQASHLAAELLICKAIQRAKCEVLAVPGAH